MPSFPEERLFEARNGSYFSRLVLRYKQERLYVSELDVPLCNLPYEVRLAERPAECLNSSHQLGAASGKVLTGDGDQIDRLLTAYRCYQIEMFVAERIRERKDKMGEDVT